MSRLTRPHFMPGASLYANATLNVSAFAYIAHNPNLGCPQ